MLGSPPQNYLLSSPRVRWNQTKTTVLLNPSHSLGVLAFESARHRLSCPVVVLLPPAWLGPLSLLAICGWISGVPSSALAAGLGARRGSVLLLSGGHGMVTSLGRVVFMVKRVPRVCVWGSCLRCEMTLIRGWTGDANCTHLRPLTAITAILVVRRPAGLCLVEASWPMHQYYQNCPLSSMVEWVLLSQWGGLPSDGRGTANCSSGSLETMLLQTLFCELNGGTPGFQLE